MPTSPSNYQPTDRRPIASRGSPVWIRTSKALARAGVSANGISVAGMACALLAGIALTATAHVPEPWDRVLWLAAAGLCQLRLLANLLDGMVAIERGIASPVGELFNEVPDRISDSAILIGLGYGAGSTPVLGFVAAVFALIVAYVRAAARVAGAPQDYRGPMAKQHRMFVVTTLCVFAAFTPYGWHAMLLGSRVVSASDIALIVIIIGCLITTWRRLAHASRLLSARHP